MVMKINTGVPGSGKTYLMIKSFVDLFCQWNKETELFEMKPEHHDKVLISNIEGLKLDHLDIETLMSERCMQLARTKWAENVSQYGVEDMDDVIDQFYFEFLQEKVRWFFSYDYQKALSEKYGAVIYLIEESQRYFDGKELGRAKWVRDIYFFFEKHRHMGFSIFCDTQHVSKISKGISCLFETETRAKPRTLSLMGEFKYNEFSDGVKTNQVPIVVRPDKRVYSTYKSMNQEEVVKTKRPAAKILVFVLIMIGLSVSILNYAKNNLGPGDAIAANPAKVSSPPPALLASGSAQPPAPQKPSFPPGRWVHLAHTASSKGVTVVHPLTFSIMPLKELDLPVKRQGTQLYCFIEDENYGP